MLNTCFLELLIKICHAVINSFKNVAGSNPHQGKRGADSFPFQWIIGLGKDTDPRESSSVICRGSKCCHVYAGPASISFPLSAPCLVHRLTVS